MVLTYKVELIFSCFSHFLKMSKTSFSLLFIPFVAMSRIFQLFFHIIWHRYWMQNTKVVFKPNAILTSKIERDFEYFEWSKPRLKPWFKPPFIDIECCTLCPKTHLRFNYVKSPRLSFKLHFHIWYKFGFIWPLVVHIVDFIDFIRDAVKHRRLGTLRIWMWILVRYLQCKLVLEKCLSLTRVWNSKLFHD